MSIERIKQQAAEADQRIRELAKVQGQPEQEGETSEGEVELQNDDQGVVAHTATGDDTNEDFHRIKSDAEKWEQRYRSLNGMIEARDRQIEQLHQLLAGMQQASVEVQKPAQPKTSLISSEDEEAFGGDLIDLARRVAREEGDVHLAKLEARLAEMQERLQGVAQTTAVTVQDRFEQQLTKAVPTWRKIDESPKFIDWLQSSPTRVKVFSEAAKGMDVDGVAYFYAEFAEKMGVESKPKTDPRLEKQLAPGRSKSTNVSQTGPQDKKVWTRSEISRFFSHGRKEYSQAEYNSLEKDIFNAQTEGRVDYSR